MRRSLRTPLALLGLLLAVAMVCTTSAQAPKPDAPAAGTPEAPTSESIFQRIMPETSTPNDSRADRSAPAASGSRVGRDHASEGELPGGSNDPLSSRPDRFRPPVAESSPSRHTQLLVVGRYQAVSHNGRLIAIDTATGECFRYNGSRWDSFAPPIESDAAPAPTNLSRGPANEPSLP